ncbi:acyl-CoA dehydrogenase family protein [Phaeobacter gallaeciensis]|uniref:acyl-CoA dehydrogenase family protein n=1 Tax=Phaeobacter gallaeciensis TaxID=60890 RepID=UPI000BBCCF8D|nr:acyl-CoA dehydrogenase family protein [Phaeobacter gallaeciensis]ATF18567.1 Acyl-CoA dehydrogenase [Phaeobacter gallaeciensis]ATF22676.1 Acyl-CoA dehydrogenase [Phaeobacter gallaeciensis]
MFKRSLFEPDHECLRQQVAEFLDAEVVPHHPQWMENRQAPRRIWQQAGEAGLLCRTIPEDHGGHGGDFRQSVVIIEELAKRRLCGLLTFLQSDIVAPYLYRLGNDIQRQEYLPGLCSGRRIGAIALTEPQGGSDLHGLRSTAIRNQDEIILTGEKTHISNGSEADLIIVAARTGPTDCDGASSAGFDMLLVEAGTPGLTRRRINKTGMPALDTGHLTFDNCRVPEGNRLGASGMGFFYLVSFLSIERLVLATYAQAMAETLLRETVRFCATRRTAEGTTLDYQATQFRLADLYSEAATSRSFVDSCIVDHTAGRLDNRNACIAKLRSTELLTAAAAAKLQLSGARGFCDDGSDGPDRATQDVLDSAVQTVWGGSSEVLRNVVGSSLANML